MLSKCTIIYILNFTTAAILSPHLYMLMCYMAMQ